MSHDKKPEEPLDYKGTLKAGKKLLKKVIISLAKVQILLRSTNLTPLEQKKIADTLERYQNKLFQNIQTKN